MAIKGNTPPQQLKDILRAGLNSFMGDYGTKKTITVKDQFAFGFIVPTSPLPLTTWSYFEDDEGCCFIDGVFYEKYFHHQPVDGEDAHLAKHIIDNFRRMNIKAIEELNGSFRGLIYDFRSTHLTTFIDRLGSKILYWSREGNNLIVTTNLASFSKLTIPALDEIAAFQFLTIGFPVGSRTLLKDVQIHTPGMTNSFRESSEETRRYWNIPHRMQGISLNACVEMIMESVEDHVERVYRRTQDNLGLALSGGHDSRVILNALVSRKVPFVPVLWRDNNFNDKIALKLCSLLNKEPIIAEDVDVNELDDIQKNVFVYSDGHYLNSFGFIRLAKLCYDRQIPSLLIGFSGDKISGSLTYPDPAYMNNIRELAQYTLSNQMELFSFDQAQSLLLTANTRLTDVTVSEWEDSFTKISPRENLSDISILQGFANRNLKRVRLAMLPAEQYVQDLFPYLDSKVLNSYFSLPFDFLKHQKAHCFAGFRRVRDFRKYPASNYPISLAQEALVPKFLYFLRLLKLKGQRLSTSIRPQTYKGVWKNLHQEILDEIVQSPLFNSGLLRKMYTEKSIYPAELYKLHTLVRFYDFYVCGNQSKMWQTF